jgi:hypothetical protein
LIYFGGLGLVIYGSMAVIYLAAQRHWFRIGRVFWWEIGFVPAWKNNSYWFAFSQWLKAINEGRARVDRIFFASSWCASFKSPR